MNRMIHWFASSHEIPHRVGYHIDMTLYGWHNYPEPDNAMKERMKLVLEDPTKRIYEIDGHRLMHNLLSSTTGS